MDRSALQIDTDTIIIGAGPAGLAVGAVLRRSNVPFAIFEQAERVGESWHRHYDRLHLHTPTSHSALPYRPYPGAYPRYPSRQQFVEYLDDYARAFDLAPELGRSVRRISRVKGEGWEVTTNAGVYYCRRVVVATGYNRVPNLPRWPGQETFPGTIIHSREYKNAKPFIGGRTLVIGFGNSGAEIALDLAEHGVQCAVAVRGKVNVIPREILGIPITRFALALRPLPPRVADRMTTLTRRLAVGNLSALGLTKRDEGPLAEVAEARQIPMIDVGTIARIRSGEIAVRKGVESFDGSEVCFADGTRERFDSVVLATGYTTGLASMLPDHGSLLDAHERPRVCGREAGVAGLYFCGFDLSSTGMLRQIGLEAIAIGRDVRQREERATKPL